LEAGIMPQADIFSTPNMLNATLPLKQDAASQAKLKTFADEFKTKWVPQVWGVLKKSNMVHYARFTVIDNKYLQILTEFDSDFITYSKFFAKELPDFFQAVFSLVDADLPRNPGGDADLSLIFDYIDKKNLRSVGGVAFSAIGPFRVPEVKRALNVTD
jgi:hypothetical protein